MKLRSIRPFAAILLLAALVFSCGKTKVIPRGKFIDIYVDMFVADQWIRDNPDVKRKTDTLKVYEGIFNRYGYTTEDYAKTVRHYMREPDKFVKVMKKVVKRLDAREKETKALIAKLEKMDKFHIKSSPVADSLLRRFSADSFYVGRPDVIVNRYYDIIFSSFDLDTLDTRDTLDIRDTLALDTLAAPTGDTLLTGRPQRPLLREPIPMDEEIIELK